MFLFHNMVAELQQVTEGKLPPVPLRVLVPPPPLLKVVHRFVVCRPERGMLEDRRRKQLLEEQIEAFDGCSRKFHTQDKWPVVHKQLPIVAPMLQMSLAKLEDYEHLDQFPQLAEYHPQS